MKIAKPKKVLKIILGIVIGVICSQLFANSPSFCAPHLVKRTQVLDEEELVETPTSRTKNLLFVGKFFPVSYQECFYKILLSQEHKRIN